jgi:uncharacterized protein YciI
MMSTSNVLRRAAVNAVNAVSAVGGKARGAGGGSLMTGAVFTCRSAASWQHGFICIGRLSSSSTTAAVDSDKSELKTFLIEYEYVENMLERRTPVRPVHFEYIKPFIQAKKLVAGGALVPAVERGVIVFRGQDIEEARAFAASDPYVTSGLATTWKVTEWLIVAGAV